MNVKVVGSGIEFPALIQPIDKGDIERVLQGGRFLFDWSREANFEIFKLTLQENQQILGLISMMGVTVESRIEVRLLEVSEENRGAGKMYDRVAGNLIAYACFQAHKRNYGGFVSLIPKSQLVDHYCNKYGFRPMGRHLYLMGKPSQRLIEKYLTNSSDVN